MATAPLVSCQRRVRGRAPRRPPPATSDRRPAWEVGVASRTCSPRGRLTQQAPLCRHLWDRAGKPSRRVPRSSARHWPAARSMRSRRWALNAGAASVPCRRHALVERRGEERRGRLVPPRPAACIDLGADHAPDEQEEVGEALDEIHGGGGQPKTNACSPCCFCVAAFQVGAISKTPCRIRLPQAAPFPVCA